MPPFADDHDSNHPGDVAPQPTASGPATPSADDPAVMPILLAKISVPVITPGHLSRPRLLAALEELTAKPLTVIRAPAGYGKTSLLAEWAASADRQIAWLSLGRRDNDFVRFWHYLVAALKQAAPSLREFKPIIARPSGSQGIDLLWRQLLDALGTPERELVLVLDDFHLIDSREIQRTVTSLISHLPPRMHVVIASRRTPSLPLSRLRLRGRLGELGVSQLRFDDEEAADFFTGAAPAPLSQAELAAILAESEGWIAGLRLLALSLQDDSGAASTRASGLNRLIADYLNDEVLNQLPEESQRFLLGASLLPRLEAPLCDAVLQTPPGYSQRLLEQLEREGALLTPLDHERGSYRYQQQFRQLLRTRLLAGGSPAIEGMYQRAVDWYEQRGETETAVQLALQSLDLERTARLIEANYSRLAMSSASGSLLQLLEMIPEELIAARPRLATAKAWCYMSQGETGESERYLLAAENAVLEQLAGEAPDEPTRALLGEIAAVRAMVAAQSLDASSIVAQAKRAASLLPASRGFSRGLISLSAGVSNWVEGDLGAARHALGEAVGLPTATGGLFLACMGRYFLAQVEYQEANLQRAIDLLEQTLQLATSAGGEPLPIANLPHIYLASLRYERNELDEAAAHLDQGLLLSSGWLWRDALRQAWTSRAALHLAHGRRGEAMAAYAQAIKLVRGRLTVPFTAYIPAAHLNLLLSAGLLPEYPAFAEQVLRQLGEQAPADGEQLRQWQVAARTLYCLGRYDAASRLLTPLLNAVEHGGFQRQLIELLVLQTLVYGALDDGRAKLSLDRALRLAEPEGYVRVFVDEGHALLTLLHSAHKQGVAPAYTSRLLTAFGATGGQVRPLSPRETEVLRLIAAGLSTREVAELLVISVGTVRNHLKAVNTALGVSSRMQAVASARRLGLF